MANLLYETNFELGEHGKKWEDVKCIFNCDGQIPVGRFRDIADQYYDSSFGSTEVREDLIIMGDDWWLERREYDGSEWWEFVTKPEIPSDIDYSNGIFTIKIKMKVIKGGRRWTHSLIFCFTRLSYRSRCSGSSEAHAS